MKASETRSSAVDGLRRHANELTQKATGSSAQAVAAVMPGVLTSSHYIPLRLESDGGANQHYLTWDSDGAMTKVSPNVLFLVYLAATPAFAQSSTLVSETTLSLPAYDEGPANPNPPFDEYATTRFNYPYPLRDNLTEHRSLRTFRAVTLENEYLKCSVLPDVGGHVYTCSDKINGVPMFYQNPTIKEAAIGMRGGWAAFGLEFNFPVSHSWTTVSPVDFAYGTNPDRSASVTVSNIDRVYGMEWTVRLTLRPGSTVLEQAVTLANRSDVRHRFYWWSNAGVQVWDDSKITYPMRFTASHGFVDVDRWPIDVTGRDLSVVKNHDAGPVSRFVHASREPFMGVWNPKTNAGVVHFANYADLPAKKIWSWGSDADGLDWRRALSDNNSQYVEVQGGLFRNQETYAFLEPRESLHFEEFWMPTRGLGGLSRANPAGAVNLARSGGTVKAALNVNQKLSKATIRLLEGSTVLRSVVENLSPERTWALKLEQLRTDKPLTFELRDHTGQLLMRQTEGQYDWTPESEVKVGLQPVTLMPPAEKRTEDDWLQLGRVDELNGRLLVAMEDYRTGRVAFPQSQSLTFAAGRLAVCLLHYNEAKSLLTVVQAADTPNPEAAYYLGLAYDGLGDTEHARAAYEIAARLPPGQAAASVRLAEMDARAGDLSRAETRLTIALSEAPEDLRSAEELTAVQQARGEKARATALVTTWQKLYPTSSFLAEVLGKPKVKHLAAEADRVLRVAAEWIRLGDYTAALAVLSRDYPTLSPSDMEPGAVAPQNSPLVGYYRAFCLYKLGRSSAEMQRTASRESVRYAFPSGAETYAVLQWAVAQKQDDATAHFLLGTLEFSVGLTKQGQAQWEQARLLGGGMPGLAADIGSAYLHLDHDGERALAAFQLGLAVDETNGALYVGIDQASSLLGHSPQEFVDAVHRFPDQNNMPSELLFELALHQAEAGNFVEAEAVFKDRFFAREEGGTNVRQVWLEVKTEKLEALARSGRCQEAMQELASLGVPQAGMRFTQDGLEPILESTQYRYRLGAMQLTCKQVPATTMLEDATSSSSVSNAAWSDKAARLLPGYDLEKARPALLAALAQASLSSRSSSAFWTYTAGALQQQLGNKVASRALLQQVFLLPDQMMAYHLARQALRAHGSDEHALP